MTTARREQLVRLTAARPDGSGRTLRRTKATRTVDRRAPLLPTAHQAVEYLLGLLLVYAGIRRSGSSTVALFVIAVMAATVAMLSPGKLGVRQLLGHRGRRVGDLVLAGSCIGLVVAITRADVIATGSLLLAAVVLVRLGLSRVPQPIRRRQAGEATRPTVARRAGRLASELQPRVNRTARAAGVFVRHRRERRTPPG